MAAHPHANSRRDAVIRAIRGRLLSFSEDQPPAAFAAGVRFIADGLLVIEDGRIAAIGEAAQLLPTLPPDTTVTEHGAALIMAGFIDLHIHLPQTRVIASYGAQLMQWLERYTYVEEAKYADPAVAEAGAAFFLGELARNGTTTAVVYGSVHPVSVEALFRQSAARGSAMIAGKVMMDRNAPAELLDSVQSSYDDSKALILRWHGKFRQRYAVTPRFAVTSSDAQLEAAGALLEEHGEVYLQTHLAENQAEIAAALALFPARHNYTEIYQHFGLLGPRSLFGHCLHLSETELDLLADSQSVAVACPTSNLFLGSGLFDRNHFQHRAKPVRTGIATDVGAGTSFSMLRTLAEAYKVQQLRGHALAPLDAFHWITRGNAAALGLQDEIGSLSVGCFADLVVLDSRATPAMAHRMERCESLDEELFVLMTLGDDRAVGEVYLQGRAVL